MFFVFFFNDTATTEIYTLSLHDALPIYLVRTPFETLDRGRRESWTGGSGRSCIRVQLRSEEHTSELQSLRHLVCRLLLEKKKQHAELRDQEQTDQRTPPGARAQEAHTSV